jgi:DNA repair protein RadA/Sms
MPRRTGSGIEFNRLQLLLAVLSKRVGLKLATQDVFVNVVGGFRVNEPAVDLAVCLALASATLNKRLGKDVVAIGEVGLGGEVRSVGQLEQRLHEAKKLGFASAVVAKQNRLPKTPGIDLLTVETVADAVRDALN